MEQQLPDDESQPPTLPDQPTADSRPLLVIPDSRGRIRKWPQLRQQPYWENVVALCSRTTPPTFLDYLKERQIEAIVTGDDRVDYRAALEELNARCGVKTVRVDSGGTLNGVLLRDGLVDEVSVLISPSLVGGMSPRSLFRAPDLTTPEGVIPLRLMHVEQMPGDIVWLRYEVIK
jgi:2,5-diamino-6-(ribosylamino)-4(3H)-pyrimidinone 5'-phosphate reductase